MKKLFVAVVVCLVVVFTVAPSFGGVELIIPTGDRGALKDVIVYEMSKRENTYVSEVSDYHLVFVEEREPHFLFMLNPIQKPVVRTRFNLVPTEGGNILLKIEAAFIAIRQYGNAEISTFDDKKSLKTMFSILESIKAKFDPSYIPQYVIEKEKEALHEKFKKGYVPLGVKIEGNAVKAVESGLAGEKIGIKNGDVILEVNGKPAGEIQNLQNYIEERYDGGRSVLVMCERDGKREILTVKKIKID